MRFSDVRQVVRGLSRRPGFAAAAVVTLGLGIGATSTVYSALHHTLLRPLPFADSERLGYLWLSSPGGMSISPEMPHVDAWREARTLDGLALYESGEFPLYGEMGGEYVGGARIDGALAEMLGVEPILGRFFTADEATGGASVVVLSEGFWRERYGADRGVLGSELRIGDSDHQIIGVAPDRLDAFLDFASGMQIWLPYAPGAEETPSVLARLRADVDTAAVHAELSALSDGLPVQSHPDGDWSPRVMGARDFVDYVTRRGLPVLFAAVAAVLLIACANVTGLLLIRVAARERELAIRTVLGAGRAEIAGLLLLEALLIAAAGGVAGVLVAHWLTNGLQSIRPDALDSLDAMSVSGTILVFAMAATVAAGLLAGVTPALTAARQRTQQGLAGIGRVTRRTRAREMLVAGQIATTVVLLTGALILVRSFAYLQSRDIGFDPERVLTFELSLPQQRYPTEDARRSTWDQLRERLRATAGVTDIAIASGVPSEMNIVFGGLQVADRELQPEERESLAQAALADADFARVLGLRLVEGRFLQNQEPDPDVVVLSRGWARRLWPSGAVGQRMKMSTAPDAPWLRVVGVVEDLTLQGAPGARILPQMYRPAEASAARRQIVIRTGGDGRALQASIRTALRAVDPLLIPRNMNTMTALVSGTMAVDRFLMLLLGGFAALALTLSVIGLYGVISHAVSQRTREIGIRAAIGATPADIARMVLTGGLRLTAAGAAVGILVALWAVTLLGRMVHGIAPHDAASFSLAAVLLLVAAIVAMLIPTRRAVRVEPVVALQAE